MSSEIRERPYHNETDFKKVWDLLVTTYPITPVGFNWEIRRWEGWCFHHELQDEPPWDKVHLWEAGDGRLVGAVHPEGKGEAHLQLHPDFRSLEAEMIAWAEANLAAPDNNGQQRLDIFALRHLFFQRAVQQGECIQLHFAWIAKTELCQAQSHNTRTPLWAPFLLELSK